MIYQKLLVGKDPYFVLVDEAKAFETHRHPEVELSYCHKGSYTITIENQDYIMCQGDLAIILPMATHEFPLKGSPESQRVTIELGPALLGHYFQYFTNTESRCMVCNLKKASENQALYTQLEPLLEKIINTYTTHPVFYDLQIKGDIYNIAAIILQLFFNFNDTVNAQKRVQDIAKIEKALTTIYNRYYEPLSIENISSDCGYSTSNFCKIFKAVTGDTFHNLLNKHRIEIACIHLKNSNDSIEDISVNVGFSDAKSFCRVFKQIMGESAGTYRKRHLK